MNGYCHFKKMEHEFSEDDEWLECRTCGHIEPLPPETKEETEAICKSMGDMAEYYGVTIG